MTKESEKCKKCDRDVHAKGLCRRHYDEEWKHERKSTAKKCTISGCDNPMSSRGMCSSHYMKEKRKGMKNKEVVNGTCSICGRKHFSRGLCSKHYAIAKRNGEFSNGDKCLVENCENLVLSSGNCEQHYQQLRYHNETLERTTRDSNEIIRYEEYAEMVIYDKDHNEIYRVMIDIGDVDKIKVHKWSPAGRGYTIATFKEGGKKRKIRLHRYIMNIHDTPEAKVDHIDRNTRNNRKENLRICTQAENARNKSLLDSNKSGVTGVFWHKTQEIWHSSISINYKSVFLGTFTDKENAIKARLFAEAKYFGEYSPQIHLFEKYGVIYSEISNNKSSNSTE